MFFSWYCCLFLYVRLSAGLLIKDRTLGNFISRDFKVIILISKTETGSAFIKTGVKEILPGLGGIKRIQSSVVGSLGLRRTIEPVGMLRSPSANIPEDFIFKSQFLAAFPTYNLKPVLPCKVCCTYQRSRPGSLPNFPNRIVGDAQ